MKCSYPKCKTGLHGLVIPIASFLPASIDGKPVPAYMPRGHAIIGENLLCESCAVTADVHVIVTDKRWAEIQRGIAAAGGGPPDRASLVLLLGSPKDKPLPRTFIEAMSRMRQMPSHD